MNRGIWNKWELKLGMGLVILSAVVYLIHYLIFRDAHHIFLYLVGDIAFVFIEVLLVTLVFHELLSQREKRQRLEKLNMVIGAFFSQVGFGLLRHFSDWDPKLDSIREQLQVNALWSEEKFDKVDTLLAKYEYRVDPARLDVEVLKAYLSDKLDFLLRLLENPNVLEHETFTSLLMAVFHLSEEIVARRNVSSLPEADLKHLAGDVNRVYGQLVDEWLRYMRYLRRNYPYLFSLAVRTNPFDESATAVVTS